MPMNIIAIIGCVLMLRVSYASLLSSIYLLDSINLHGCPNRLQSYYPKCGATKKNMGYDTKERKYVRLCPSISSGQYPPDCHCRYGRSYVASSNSCPDPKCPTKSVTHRSYPNCECTEPNEEYNAYLNECVMKCPANSTGRFPDCKCNDESEGFSKEWFKCDKCPEGSRPGSVFPNCECETGNYLISLWGDYINVCVSCEDGLTGDYPHCKECTNGRKKNHRTQGYYTCFDSRCPDDSDGVYPGCSEETIRNYAEQLERDRVNRIKNYECGPGSCPGYTKNIDEFPCCECTDANATFTPDRVGCGVCPFNSIGIYPNCTCNDKDHLFSPYWNFCYPDCLEPSRYSLIPDLSKCVDRYAYPGRQCPPDSIGVSPDCHCIDDSKVFHPYGWGCYDRSLLAWGSNMCTNQYEKWPQCGISIDGKVVISMVG